MHKNHFDFQNVNESETELILKTINVHKTADVNNNWEISLVSRLIGNLFAVSSVTLRKVARSVRTICGNSRPGSSCSSSVKGKGVAQCSIQPLDHRVTLGSIWRGQFFYHPSAHTMPETTRIKTDDPGPS